MYKNSRVKNLFIFGFILGFGLPRGVFGFDLLEELNSSIQGFNTSSSSEYMNRAYSSNFSKDPFGDAVSSIVNMSSSPKFAGVDYVKKSLENEGCPMSDKKIIGILFYYVEDFKLNLVRNLKIELGDYDTTKYEVGKDKVDKYCRDFFACVESKGYSSWQIFKNTLKCAERDENGNCIKDGKGTNYTVDDKLRPITKGTSANLETNCKEFFESAYYKGMENEQNKLNVQISQVGVDKYWNKTTDDSQYDIMEDIGEIARLLYLDVQNPITPAFYHIPSFTNSEKSLLDLKEPTNFTETIQDGTLETSEQEGTEDNEDKDEENKNKDKEDGSGIRGDGEGNPTDPFQKPISSLSFDEISEYDDLLEGLGAYTLTNNGTQFYTNLCDDEESGDESEIEKKDDQVNKSSVVDDLSEEEYQEIIDYMLDAVDNYDELPSEKDKEIEEIAGDKTTYGLESSADDLQKTADSIKNCRKSCDGLRIDQKASCMVKCACGEWSSASIKLFDPNDMPGLGPILVIRFCAIPAVDSRFSVGGKRILSIEEGVKEIYGVTDKLSREGKLGIWTRQNEFLDSSTKKMNFANSFAFTIDVEFPDSADKKSESSEQFKKKELKNNNETAQVGLGIKNSLDTPAGSNAYTVVGNPSLTAQKSLGDSTNLERSAKLESELSEKFGFYGDLFKEADADLHVMTELDLSLWLKQQMGLWTNTEKALESLKSSADLLKGKKCK